MIKLSHPLDKCKESTVHLKFTYEEMNALHYAAGYISAKSNKEKVSPPTEGRPSTRKLGAPFFLFFFCFFFFVYKSLCNKCIGYTIASES